MDAEEVASVHPGCAREPASGTSERLKLGDRVLVRVLGGDAFARREAEGAPQDSGALRARADQVDLDAALVRIVAGAVAESGEVEVAAQLAIDAGEKVQVEGGGDPFFIVVGAHEAVGVFFK